MPAGIRLLPGVPGSRGIAISGIEHLNSLRAGKSRVTLMLDEDRLMAYQEAAGAQDMDYQALINDALGEHLQHRPVDEATLRRVLREELGATA